MCFKKKSIRKEDNERKKWNVVEVKQKARKNLIIQKKIFKKIVKIKLYLILDQNGKQLIF